MTEKSNILRLETERKPRGLFDESMKSLIKRQQLMEETGTGVDVQSLKEYEMELDERITYFWG